MVMQSKEGSCPHLLPAASSPCAPGYDNARIVEKLRGLARFTQVVVPPSKSCSSTASSSSDSTSSTLTSERAQKISAATATAAVVEAASSIILGGCTGCHMYVMIHRDKPRCPKCMSTAVLKFFYG